MPRVKEIKKIEKWTEENLPSWEECKRILENREYNEQYSINQVVDEEPIPTALHEFIYENEPQDSENFRAQLIELLNDKPFREGLMNVFSELSNLRSWKGTIFNITKC